MSSARPTWWERFAALTVLALLAGGPPVSAATETATLSGRLLDPKGRPARGLNAVVQNVDTLEEFYSPASAEDGRYTVAVPPAARYRIVAAITPRGGRLPVVAAEPVDVPASGTYVLPEVRFTRRDRDGASAGTRPWYRTPGGLVGIVTGSAAALIFAFDNGDGDTSPSVP